jgi:hypothetical protein
VLDVKVVASWVVALLVVIGVGVGIEAGLGVGRPALATVDGKIFQVEGAVQGPPFPVYGATTLTNVSSGVSYHASCTRTSGFSVTIPPGTYSLSGSSGHSFSDGEAVSAGPFLARPGATVHINLYVGSE